MSNLKLCVVLICAIHWVNSAKILGISHMNSYSHFIMSDRIYRELAVRGHEVTVITPFEQKEPIKNLRHVVMSNYNDKQNAAKTNMFARAEMSVISSARRLNNFALFFTETVLNDTNVKNLLNSNDKFDLIMYEQFLNEAFGGFAYHYKAPRVILSGIRTSRWSSPQMGNPSNPSYIPDIFTSFANNMTFLERTYNSLLYLTCELFDHLWRLPAQNQLLQKYFPGAPHILDLYYNISLTLVNSHVSVNPAVPLVPNMIEIGGYHLVPSKPLPKDLQEILDGANDGAIFFSMGSNLKSKELSVEKRNEILKAFGRLKQKVLWKWEDDVLPGQPPNVVLGKWLPQQDILAHPNVKLFITHGGMLSIMEAIYHGVPILGIPVFGDQDVNVKHAEYEGFGLGIPFTKLSSNVLTSTMNELLNNKRYLTNARKRSQIMRDQPTQPLDRAIYWIEYVIRHQGAPHLRTAALNLTWYQYLLLDVVAAITVILIVTIWIFCKIAKWCCRKTTKHAVSINKKCN